MSENSDTVELTFFTLAASFLLLTVQMPHTRAQKPTVLSGQTVKHRTETRQEAASQQ